MSIELILATLSLNVACGNLSDEEKLNFRSVYAYGIERLEEINHHTNCTSTERDIFLRRLHKRLARSLQDLLDGDYGHC